MEANKSSAIHVLDVLQQLFILFDSVLLNFELNYTLNVSTQNTDAILQRVKYLENKREIIQLISLIKRSNATLDYKGVLRGIIGLLEKLNTELYYICNVSFTKPTNSSAVSRGLQVELKKYLVAFAKIISDLDTIIKDKVIPAQLSEEIYSIFAAEEARIRAIETEEARKRAEKNAENARRRDEESKQKQGKGKAGLLSMFTAPKKDGGKRNKMTVKRNKRLTKLKSRRA
jgi:hypothetical protein